MKKLFVFVAVLTVSILMIISASAINYNTHNGVTFYIPRSSYEEYQLGMLAYRPRFSGTFVASNTGSTRDDETHFLMNYFPIPTNWYGYNGGVYYGEESFLMQPTQIQANEYSYNRVYYVDTESGNNNVLSMEMGGSGLYFSAPDLYFDGIIGLYYNDGYSIRFTNIGDVAIYVGFEGEIYLDHGTSYEIHEYENAFTITPADGSVSIDSLIRSDLYGFYDIDCDLYFKGTFCAITNSLATIVDGEEYKYRIDLYGDNASMTYVNGEITQDASSSYVLDKFTRVVSYGSDNANPTPSGTLDITSNGVYNVSKYANVNVQVPLNVEWSGMYDWLIGTFNAFTRFEIAPGWSIGVILSIIVGLAVIMWILKIFMGG